MSEPPGERKQKKKQNNEVPGIPPQPGVEAPPTPHSDFLRVYTPH